MINFLFVICLTSYYIISKLIKKGIKVKVKKKVDSKSKVLLIISFIIVMVAGGYFTYTALDQGIMFAYIENLSVQGLDKSIVFDYVFLLLIKTLVAFMMYSFIVASIFIVLLPLILLSLFPFKSNCSRL